MNLVQLFTIDGALWIDTKQLNGPRTCLTIYTRCGNRLKDVGRTLAIRERAMFGVHRDNLFATHDKAIADSDRIMRDIYGDRDADPPAAPIKIPVYGA